ncbi:MAG: hydrogenase expression/formation protein HypE [Lachnospiraceae bacterium]|nr:hydrogenase expression/formation protein HypE [Lachnospiraceae bacterium]
MKIVMAHGSGGDMTRQLIEEIFADTYGNEYLSQMEDSTVLPGSEKIAFTTDSFVVEPLEFPGGDIGRLAVCGTVNDLAMRGAVPKYLTCGFILEEGLEFELLKRVVKSMAETAKEAGVMIVAGDTKVVEGNGGMYINTSGIGFINNDIQAKRIEAGDVVLVSGTVGDHHSAILSARLGVGNSIASDVAPLNIMVKELLDAGITIHAMRDITRGGLATVLNELAETSGKSIEIEEEDIPVSPVVKSFAGLMGLEPVYMGNEGKMVVVLPKHEAETALHIMKGNAYGAEACAIGKVYECTPEEKPELIMKTSIGGSRVLGILSGEGLPRIC